MGQALVNLAAAILQKGLRYVGTRGNINSPICFTGEAPGADEDQAGYPFVGASGRLLDRIIAEAGISTNDCWFTNPYKTRPPNNDLSLLHTCGVPLQLHEEAFYEELEERKPTIIVAAGATPLGLLCPETRNRRTGELGITKWRGSLLTCSRFSWPHFVIPIFHPAFLLRDWSEKEVNVFILKRIKEEFDYYQKNGTLQPLPVRELIVEPSADLAIEYLTQTLAEPDPTSVDIELLRRRVLYCISFARNPTSAISICMFDYSHPANVRIWRLIDEILRTKRQIGQNYLSFDCHWLYRYGFNVNGSLVDDTRIRHNVLWPELSHKLEFMCMQYTREPYYKDEGRGWSLKEGKSKLMRYNCKDTTVTYEVYNEQEKEFDEQPNLREFYTKHEKPLGGHFFNIDRRGVATNQTALGNLRAFINTELTTSCNKISTEVGVPIARNKIEQSKLGATAINLGAPAQVIKLLKSRGLKVPKNRATGNETSGEEALNDLFAATGDKVLKEILNVRELNKIKSGNVDVKLVDNTYYSVYIVGGTVGGRRASKSNPIGFGGNGQNIPKHSKLAKKFRACLVARPGKILIQCDQVSAEDWIINGIIADVSGDRRGLDELQSGVDRHQRLASYIFGIPLDQCDRDSPTIHRYVGKRTRYAGSYGMGGVKFAAVLAKEGFSIPAEHCEFLLQKFHEYDPGIRGVFQQYVERQLTDNRRLSDLFGRTRVFFGLHPYRDNSKVFREAYSYIPQSTVGDNTGEAVNYSEAHTQTIIMETHDALVTEVDDSLEGVLNGVQLMKEAFHRILRFPRGLELEIPIETEIGYDLQNLTRCASLTQTGLTSTYNTLVEQRRVQAATISGVPLSA